MRLVRAVRLAGAVREGETAPARVSLADPGRGKRQVLMLCLVLLVCREERVSEASPGGGLHRKAGPDCFDSWPGGKGRQERQERRPD